MGRAKLETQGGMEIELDLENEELLVDGVVQSGDFKEQSEFVLDQLCEGKLSRVE